MTIYIVVLVVLVPVAYALGRFSQWGKDARNAMGGEWHHRHYGK
jgi:hypothetical protein